MNAEEHFLEWWKGSSAESLPDTKEAFLFAHCLGRKEGLEEAAHECVQVILHHSSGDLNINAEIGAEECLDTIREKIKSEALKISGRAKE